MSQSLAILLLMPRRYAHIPFSRTASAMGWTCGLNLGGHASDVRFFGAQEGPAAPVAVVLRTRVVVETRLECRHAVSELLRQITHGLPGRPHDQLVVHGHP